jgi:hypothetical protein
MAALLAEILFKDWCSDSENDNESHVIWDMTLCWLVSSYWSSEGAFCLHLLSINSPTITYDFELDADKKIQSAAQPGSRWQSWKANCQKQWYRLMGTLLKAGTRLYPQA